MSDERGLQIFKVDDGETKVLPRIFQLEGRALISSDLQGEVFGPTKLTFLRVSENDQVDLWNMNVGERCVGMLNGFDLTTSQSGRLWVKVKMTRSGLYQISMGAREEGENLKLKKVQLKGSMEDLKHFLLVNTVSSLGDLGYGDNNKDIRQLVLNKCLELSKSGAVRNWGLMKLLRQNGRAADFELW